MEPLSLIAAFFGGLIAFFSPCVLPLVPAYMSLISGISVEEMSKWRENKWAVRKVLLVNALSFSAGFSLVFVLLGAAATSLGSFLQAHFYIISKIAGVVIIVLGFHIAGLFRIRYLYYEKRLNFNPRSVGCWSSFVGGIAFSFGWTPCVGPILAGVLVMAATKETLVQGVVLLALFALGMAAPFIGTAFLMSTARKSPFTSSWLRYFEFVSGAFLVAVGILIFTNDFQAVMSFVLQRLPGLEEFKAFLEDKILKYNSAL